MGRIVSGRVAACAMGVAAHPHLRASISFPGVSRHFRIISDCCRTTPRASSRRRVWSSEAVVGGVSMSATGGESRGWNQAVRTRRVPQATIGRIREHSDWRKREVSIHRRERGRENGKGMRKREEEGVGVARASRRPPLIRSVSLFYSAHTWATSTNSQDTAIFC